MPRKKKVEKAKTELATLKYNADELSIEIKHTEDSYTIVISNVNPSDINITTNKEKVFGSEIKRLLIDYSKGSFECTSDEHSVVQTSSTTLIKKELTIPNEYTDIDPKITKDKNTVSVVFEKQKLKEILK